MMVVMVELLGLLLTKAVEVVGVGQAAQRQRVVMVLQQRRLQVVVAAVPIMVHLGMLQVKPVVLDRVVLEAVLALAVQGAQAAEAATPFKIVVVDQAAQALSL